MKLVLLGTGGLIPTDTAQTACFLLPEMGILLDAGTGIYRLNAYLPAQAQALDVYLTHAHGDHTSGLVYLFASFLVHEINRSQAAVDGTGIGACVAKANELLHATRIHAAQPAVDSLSKAYEPYQMDWRLLQDQEPLPCGGLLTAFKVGGGDEVGFRLDWPGHSLAYVTDTTAVSDAVYREHIRGVNVLLHDGYGPNHLAALMSAVHHSSVSAAAQVAAQAQVGRLILVHRNPIETWSIAGDLEAARAIFPSIEAGLDGMEIEF